VFDWRISLSLAEQTMLAEIVLPAQRVTRRNILFKNWIKITGHAAMLGFETQQVMHLRMMKLFAGGPEAQSEALRMVTEKTSALAEATMTLARGGSAHRVIRRYRTHVRSNHRRLSKP
jgi:capsular polysaccharide biosynthesis protein